ncbi:hypothetical protein [Goodfellowiella coeruleoviolacea]|uniref:Uncharacterized protein n=1 Tax=Goodfellowiella coeruleoviolacea TaxID=334858 RepID=A0AAE3KFK0_9PSEU|nr:hypothetical protein [Goodfellowiella coeruleoviolacea]MCP2164494.1 hypothetical protein [Goodfellowiella coeruleoviolacea]
MNTGDTVTELGSVISRHQVANDRRWRTAAVVLAIGVLLAIGGVLLLGAGSGRTTGFVIGLAVVSLALGLVQVGKAIRGGSGEYLEVRADGLVHGSAKRTRSWGWDQVAYVEVRERPATAPLAKYFGLNYRAWIGLSDGAKIRVDGFTDRPDLFVRELHNCCASAFRPEGPGGWVRLVWAYPVLSAACVGGIVWIVNYINHLDDVARQADANSEAVQVPEASDTTFMFLGLGSAALGFLALVFVIFFFMALVLRRRR